jgi:RND family efflux transporter MFP subunit
MQSIAFSPRSRPVLVAAAMLLLLPQAGRSQPGAVATLVVGESAGLAGFEIDARVEPVRQATVAVKAGDRVRSGQMLVRIDEREAAAGVARSDAALAQAQAEARNAGATAQRTRDLRRQGFVSEAALDSAERQLEASAAGVRQAAAALAQARLARGFAAATAPFDAIVLATHVDNGDLATPGRPLLTVYAPGRLRAVVHVPASRAAVARAAQRVEVQLSGGAWVAPSARGELPLTDPVAQTVEWRLELPASAQSRPGEAVRVRFIGAADASRAAPRVLVPASAVLRRGELTAVYVVQAGRFALRAVRLGADRGGAGVEVLAGLRAGERIAADALRAGLDGAAPQ